MIIQNEFNLYPSNMLPERFCYPEKYVRISNDTSLILIFSHIIFTGGLRIMEQKGQK